MRLKKKLLLIFITVLTGFGLKFYAGPGSEWAQNYGAGVFYVVFWILVFSSLRPFSEKPFQISLIVFVLTCALEFLQLWHLPWLERIRGNFFGRALIGSDFSWLDFPHYLVGAVIGYLLILKLRGKTI